MAYSYAKGLQEKGVSATVKHFVRRRSLQLVGTDLANVSFAFTFQ